MRVVGSSANMSSLRRDKGEVIIEKKSIFFFSASRGNEFK